MTRNEYNWLIFRTGSVLTVLGFFVRCVSVYKDIFVAAVCGSGASVDAFLLATIVPLMLVQIVAAPAANSLLSSLTRLHITSHPLAVFRTFEAYLLKIVLILFILCSMLIFCAVPVSELISGSGHNTSVNVSRLLPVVAPILVVSGISTLLIMALNSFKVFSFPALTGVFSPLSIVVGLTVLPSDPALAMAWGALIGNGIQCAALTLIYATLRMRHRSAANVPATPIEIRAVVPFVLSALLMSSADIVDQAMAARIEVGAVAALGFGTRVTAFFISVCGSALASAAFPYIAEMIESHEWQKLQHMIRTYSRLIMIGGAGALLILSLLSEFIVQILFERGAFSSADTQQVTLIQILSLAQIPFYLLNTLAMRVALAFTSSRALVLVTGISILLNVALNYLFTLWIGTAGIALSTTCVYVVSAFFLFKLNERTLAARAHALP
jgi:putative peptidoglycan lipid II flippase